MAQRKVKKTKYITLFSPFLMKETKHELIGEPMPTETGTQQWAKCTRTHHTQLVRLEALAEEDSESKTVISREGAKSYDPREEYSVGDVIIHEKWDDVGLVCGKDVTSNGGFAIIVQFQINKQKRLVEKLKVS